MAQLSTGHMGPNGCNENSAHSQCPQDAGMNARSAHTGERQWYSSRNRSALPYKLEMPFLYTLTITLYHIYPQEIKAHVK